MSYFSSTFRLDVRKEFRVSVSSSESSKPFELLCGDIGAVLLLLSVNQVESEIVSDPLEECLETCLYLLSDLSELLQQNTLLTDCLNAASTTGSVRRTTE